MKTAEEKAREYVSNQFSRLEHSYEMQEMIFRTEDGFLAGYNEAMRWRDPKEELPTEGEPVIVKYMTAKGIKKYGIGKYFNLDFATRGLLRVRQEGKLSDGDR